MDSPPPTFPDPARPQRSWGKRLLSSLVCCFVAWHLFVLVVRNPLDLWWRDMERWAEAKSWWPAVKPGYRALDRWTSTYANFIGVEQGWGMFGAPLSRSAPFLAARIEFSDGTSATLRSENEPDLERYFRVGGWRQRKLEDYLVYGDPEKLREDPERPIWEAYVRWSVRRWHEQNPGDARQPERVVLVRRSVDFPTPDGPARPADAWRETDIARFTPEGRLLP